MQRWLLWICLALPLAACGGHFDRAAERPAELAWNLPQSGAARAAPRIVPAAAFLQCVPYARELSGIQLRGDAWTWWPSAEGHYRRGSEPSRGAVLVLTRGRHLRAGHLAVVTQVLNQREIVVRHANWLNQGRIHLDTPVIDVSPGNDWTLVRVWYTPGATYGGRRYEAAGFIYGEPVQAAL